MTKIIAVSNHKGGVGKTTSTVNLGAALASKGHKVCLVDLDPQANLTQSFFKTIDPERSIYHNLKGTYVATLLPVSEKLSVIPSSLDLSAAEIELSCEPGREQLLKDVLSGEIILDEKFDYILIDCPPSLGLLTLNALTAAQDVLIPLQAEYLPLTGLVRLKEVIEKVKKRLNPGIKISGVFFTKFDPRRVLNKDVAEDVRGMFGDTLLKTNISSNIALAEAPSAQKDIFSYDNTCKGAMDYMALCEEILEKERLDEKEKL